MARLTKMHGNLHYAQQAGVGKRLESHQRTMGLKAYLSGFERLSQAAQYTNMAISTKDEKFFGIAARMIEHARVELEVLDVGFHALKKGIEDYDAAIAEVVSKFRKEREAAEAPAGEEKPKAAPKKVRAEEPKVEE